MYNPLQARDPLGKWVKEHGGASIEDVVSKTSVVDLENMVLDDRTPTAVLNNLATTEYGFNHPFDEGTTYPNANGEPPKDARENQYNYEQQSMRYDANVRCTAIENGADDTALSVCRFDYNPEIRNAVARKTDDEHTLDVLSSDESWKVRGAVAGNPPYAEERDGKTLERQFGHRPRRGVEAFGFKSGTGAESGGRCRRADLPQGGCRQRRYGEDNPCRFR